MDLLAVAERMLEEEPDIGALLLECGAFCPHAAKLRLVAGLPVFDFVTLASSLMASVTRVPSAGEYGDDHRAGARLRTRI